MGYRKSKADFAFIMHSLAYLSPIGTASIVCFPGILYRKGAEQKIRKYLVDNNYIDTIIQLPANLFYGTSIANCIMVLKKNKADDTVQFIELFGQVAKYRDVLRTFDEFEEESARYLSIGDFQDYASVYLDYKEKCEKDIESGKVSILNDVVFCTEYVDTTDINVDYIDREIKSDPTPSKVLLMEKATRSSPELRSKKDLIKEFCAEINMMSKEERENYSLQTKLGIVCNNEIQAIIMTRGLNDKVSTFIKKCIKTGDINLVGSEFDSILPRLSRFSQINDKKELKKNVVEDIEKLIDSYTKVLYGTEE